MAKNPAFLFYSADFYIGTLDMTDEQVGQYIRLMCMQHQKGRLSGQVMLDAMRGRFDEKVMSKFMCDDNGMYYNARLAAEIEKRNSYTLSRRNNLDKNPASHIGAHTDNHMGSSYAAPICSSHMENENLYINNNINLALSKDLSTNVGVKAKPRARKDADAFKAFWSVYPKKKSKADAEKAFYALNPDSELLTKMLSALGRAKTCQDWTKDGGQFIPHAATSRFKTHAELHEQQEVAHERAVQRGYYITGKIYQPSEGTRHDAKKA